ncbi:hypothetical protein [Xanthomonas sp. XNM01]|uniref:hypothetical protein n=1 Tax=Xanthomonas sp. XNM01 TaxID=2769289 RepID=UPI00177B39DD|nr:hypothetical protein [Xanthomonas sp. XNM01]MBD9368404.1 hypothetical protein [Xanthomonas sp. XNM01]
MDVRWVVVVAALAAGSVQAQTVRAVGPQGVQAPHQHKPQQPYNSMRTSSTPFNCEQYRRHPHPGMLGFCEGMEVMSLQNEARRQGRPVPSTGVLSLPGLGTPEARELGVACVNGQALRKLQNGWEQVMAAGGGWQRCRGG